MHTDTDLDWMLSYRGSSVEPEDFDTFWAETLAEAEGPLDVTVEPVDTPLTTIDVYDVTFTGWGGTRVRAWLRTPAGATGPLPTVVNYVGYGGGRGMAEEALLWASSGFAHLHMDTRGQGSSWSRGDTQDEGVSGPQIPGMMTRGIDDRSTYYYRRLIVDAVRAVDVARSLKVVDPDRVFIAGGSQAGGLSLAVAGLRDDVRGVAAYVPFLCDFPRATRITDAYPYREIADYLKTYRERVDPVHRTLSYFDGTHFAKRATAPALVSVSLMDPICPPSTVYAAINNYAGDTRVLRWDYNGHEGGQVMDELAAIAFFREVS